MLRLLLGLGVGSLLALMRAPLGSDLLEIPAVPAETSLFVRALALVVAALAIELAPRKNGNDESNGTLLCGCALGFLAVGLGGRLDTGPDSWLYLVLPAVLALLFVLDRRGRGSAAAAPDGQTTSLVSIAGIFVVSIGIGIGLEALARHVRLLGLGIETDDSVFGGVFVLALAFGGLAFGRYLRAMEGDRARGRAVDVALLVTSATTFVGGLAIAGVCSPQGLKTYLLRFGMDVSASGTLDFDALVAGVVFIVPAFALGTAVYCARARLQLGSMLAGGAVGLLLVPRLLALDPETHDLETLAPYSASLITQGAWISAGGGLAFVFAGPGAGSVRAPARAASAVLAIACAALAAFLPIPRVPVPKAWVRFPKRPRMIFELPAGQILVEAGGANIDRITLDHRELTPPATGARADRERLVLSFNLLEPDAFLNGPDILLVGQLSPGRAIALRDLGARRVDRTAAWWPAMRGLEAYEFQQAATEPPEGEVLDLGTARQRLDAGEYDLVIVPPVPGRVPLVPDVEVPDGTVAVAWYDTTHYLARREIDRPVMLSADGFEALAVGVVWGAETPVGPRPGLPAFVEPGEPDGPDEPGGGRPRVLDWLELRDEQRQRASRAAFAARLARANASNEWAHLTKGLELHYASQEHSSPYETPEQRTELDATAMEELFLAASVAVPDAFTRELYYGLARVLVGKRQVADIYLYVEPVAEYWYPAPELEKALAHADIEELDPASAVTRLAPLRAADPDDLDVLRLLARAHTVAEDHLSAADVWRDVAAHEPRARRQLGISLFHAGDAEGRAILESLLAEEPLDDELRELLGIEGEPLLDDDH